MSDIISNEDYNGSMFKRVSPGDILSNEGWERLTLPRFIAPDEFPIGAALEAYVVKIQDDFTGREDMVDAKNLWLRTMTGEEILFPITGVIAAALSRCPNVVGKTIAILRLPDGRAKKYHDNRMFMFEIAVKKM